MVYKMKGFSGFGNSPMKDDHNEAAWQAQVIAEFDQLPAAEQLTWANEHRRTFDRHSETSTKERNKNIMRYKKVYTVGADADIGGIAGTIWGEDESNFYSDAFKEKLAGSIDE